MVRLTDRPDMTLDVYRGRKNNNTTTTKNSVRIIQSTVNSNGFCLKNRVLFNYYLKVSTFREAIAKLKSLSYNLWRYESSSIVSG